MSGASFADVIDGLIAVYKAAVPADVMVIDGDPPMDPPRKFLCVGWDPEAPAATARLTGSDAGWSQTDNEFAIGCLLSYWDGSKAARLSVVRRAAVDLFNLSDAALAADRYLGGVTIGNAATSEAMYVPDTNREGALVELRWTVSGNATS